MTWKYRLITNMLLLLQTLDVERRIAEVGILLQSTSPS